MLQQTSQTTVSRGEASLGMSLPKQHGRPMFVIALNYQKSMTFVGFLMTLFSKTKYILGPKYPR